MTKKGTKGFAAQKQALVLQLREARKRPPDPEAERILLDALDTLALHQGVTQLVRASDAEALAMREAHLAQRRLQNAQEALAVGNGTVARVQAAEVALRQAEGAAREAAMLRLVLTEACRQDLAHRREAGAAANAADRVAEDLCKNPNPGRTT